MRVYCRFCELDLASCCSDFASKIDAFPKTLTFALELYGAADEVAAGFADGELAESMFCSRRRHSVSLGVVNTGSCAVCVTGALKDVGGAFCDTLIVVKFGVNRLYAEVGA